MHKKCKRKAEEREERCEKMKEFWPSEFFDSSLHSPTKTPHKKKVYTRTSFFLLNFVLCFFALRKQNQEEAKKRRERKIMEQCRSEGGKWSWNDD
jgi:hypothetical protein